MQLKFINSPDPFMASQTGGRLDQETRCEQHDEPAVFLALFGNRRSQYTPGQHSDRLDVLIPRCVLAELLGSVMAEIRHEEGEAAAADFLARADARAQTLTAPLREARAAGRDCCQAAWRTNGAEHTCGRHQT